MLVQMPQQSSHTWLQLDESHQTVFLVLDFLSEVGCVDEKVELLDQQLAGYLNGQPDALTLQINSIYLAIFVEYTLHCLGVQVFGI